MNTTSLAALPGKPAAGEKLLEVDELAVEFRSRDGVTKAVNGISFSVDKQEAVAIVGESGSGKSVTALAVMGLLRSPPAFASFASMKMDGSRLPLHEPHTMRALRGRSMSMVFQDPMRSLNPVMSIGAQLAQIMRANNVGEGVQDRRKRAIEILERVRLPEAASRIDDYPHQFSGGMRQRVLMAMALCCGPQLLIADEPTTALDVTVQAQIMDLLKTLQEELEMSIVLISHDLGLVAGFADRVHVMYAGRFVEVGPVSQVLGAPAHPYTRALLDSIPVQHKRQARLRVISGAPPLPTELPSGCPFHPRCPAATEQCLEVPPVVDLQPNHYAECWYAGDFETIEMTREEK